MFVVISHSCQRFATEVTDSARAWSASQGSLKHCGLRVKVAGLRVRDKG